ncbi:MAG: hypothetical protein HRT44_05010 [Bdellovibrionales bacterium]|nr:hypothetical protein [Bdellovibrionales bacterium]NQZ18601.1 hypothetical protein [Bdellovibrionales bacterium]
MVQSENHLPTFRKFVVALFRSGVSSNSKNDITYRLINEIYSAPNKALTLQVINSILVIWENHGFPSTDFSSDEMLYQLYSYINETPVLNAGVTEATRLISTFTKEYQGPLNRSLRFIFTSEDISLNRREFFSSLKYGFEEKLSTISIPDGLISESMSSAGSSATRMLLDSGIQINPNTQLQAPVAVVMEAQNSAVALSLLNALKSKGILFNNEYGREALNQAIVSLLVKSHDYTSVIDFFLNLNPSPISSMTSSEVSSVFTIYLSYIEEQQMGFESFSLFLEKVPQLTEEDSILTGRTSVFFNIDMSIAMRYLIVAYNVYEANEGLADDMLENFDKILSKTSSKLGFNVQRSRGELAPHESLPSNIMALSILFYLGAPYENTPIPNPKEDPYNWQGISPQYFNPTVFYDSPDVKPLLAEKDFWKSVIEKLHGLGFNLNSVNGFSLSHLAFQVANSPALSNVSVLKEILSSTSFDSKRNCSFPEQAFQHSDEYFVHSPALEIARPILKRRATLNFDEMSIPRVQFALDTIETRLDELKQTSDVTPPSDFQPLSCINRALRNHTDVNNPNDYNSIGVLNLVRPNEKDSDILTSLLRDNIEPIVRDGQPTVQVPDLTCVFMPHIPQYEYTLIKSYLKTFYDRALGFGDNDCVTLLRGLHASHNFINFDQSSHRVRLCYN